MGHKLTFLRASCENDEVNWGLSGSDRDVDSSIHALNCACVQAARNKTFGYLGSVWGQFGRLHDYCISSCNGRGEGRKKGGQGIVPGTEDANNTEGFRLDVALGWAEDEGCIDALVLHPILQICDCIVDFPLTNVELVQPVDECILPEICRQRFVEVGRERPEACLEADQLRHPELVGLGLARVECLLHLRVRLVDEFRVVREDRWTLSRLCSLCSLWWCYSCHESCL